jgi:hypothetical protein
MCFNKSHLNRWSKLLRSGNWLRQFRHRPLLPQQRNSRWSLCLGSFESSHDVQPTHSWSQPDSPHKPSSTWTSASSWSWELLGSQFVRVFLVKIE